MRWLLQALLVFFILSVVRLIADAIILEPHYFWAQRAGLLRPPVLVLVLPLTLLADLAAACVIVSAVRAPYVGRLAAAALGTFFCLVAAHLGQGDALKLPLMIPAVWAVTSGAAAYAGAWVVDQLRPDPAFSPEPEPEPGG